MYEDDKEADRVDIEEVSIDSTRDVESSIDDGKCTISVEGSGEPLEFEIASIQFNRGSTQDGTVTETRFKIDDGSVVVESDLDTETEEVSA